MHERRKNAMGDWVLRIQEFKDLRIQRFQDFKI
jgi:hypothetical protein